MSAISVHRWHSRYRVARAQPVERVAAWNAGLARMDDVSLQGIVGDDEWVCVRRLELALRLREDDGDVQASHAWSESLAAQLMRELREGSPDNIVRYRDRRDALSDLLYRAAMGDLGRAWAWRRMGLLREGDASRNAILGQAIATLAAEPAWIRPTLWRLLAAEPVCGAWTALVSALEASHWDALLAASPSMRALRRIDGIDTAPSRTGEAAADRFAQAVLAWAASHAHAALRIERTLAIFVAADATTESMPDALLRERLAVALGQVRSIASRRIPAKTESASMRASRAPTLRSSMRDVREHSGVDLPPRPEPSARVSIQDRAGAPAMDADAALQEPPEAPALPEAVDTARTEWGGLLFLLNLVPELGFVEDAGGTLPLRLRHLAIAHLAIPADDPAVRAFCGGWEPRRPVEIGDGLEEAVARAARRLREILERRLDLAEGDDRVAWVCRRAGVLRFEPGWIELVMDARAADTRVRRAALDLDPGWVPWLGCIVRFRYE